MKTTRLARGTCRLIEDAILSYVQTRGCNPYALVLHPVHVRALWREGLDRLAQSVDGVRMLWTPLTEAPFLMDERGNSYEL